MPLATLQQGATNFTLFPGLVFETPLEVCPKSQFPHSNWHERSAPSFSQDLGAAFGGAKLTPWRLVGQAPGRLCPLRDPTQTQTQTHPKEPFREFTYQRNGKKHRTEETSSPPGKGSQNLLSCVAWKGSPGVTPELASIASAFHCLTRARGTDVACLTCPPMGARLSDKKTDSPGGNKSTLKSTYHE